MMVICLLMLCIITWTYQSRFSVRIIYMNENRPENHLDILRQIERLTELVNRIVAERGRPVFSRYPLTFALLVLFGVIMVSEGVKGLLEEWGLLENAPWTLLVIGIVILVLTGSLYRKLGGQSSQDK